jgi:hypothetical protein
MPLNKSDQNLLLKKAKIGQGIEIWFHLPPQVDEEKFEKGIVLRRWKRAMANSRRRNPTTGQSTFDFEDALTIGALSTMALRSIAVSQVTRYTLFSASFQEMLTSPCGEVRWLGLSFNEIIKAV